MTQNQTIILNTLKHLQKANFGELQQALPQIKPVALRHSLASLREQNIVDKENFKYYVK